jgi:hypothetical protein
MQLIAAAFRSVAPSRGDRLEKPGHFVLKPIGDRLGARWVPRSALTHCTVVMGGTDPCGTDLAS